MDPTIRPSKKIARGPIRVPTNPPDLSDPSGFSQIPSGLSGIYEKKDIDQHNHCKHRSEELDQGRPNGRSRTISKSIMLQS